MLFKTDLFVFRQRDEDIDNWSVGGDCAGWFYIRLLLMDRIQHQRDPLMEDWGWAFDVLVDGVTVTVNVWAFPIENCWLFEVKPISRFFGRQSEERLLAAKGIVTYAIEMIMEADARILNRTWYANDPFKLGLTDF